MRESRTPATVGAYYSSGVPVPGGHLGDEYVDRLRRQRDTAWDEVTRLRGELAELRLQAQTYWYAAHHDELTGLPNRRALRDHVTRLTLAATCWVACAVIDLDGFKAINDQYGHAAGDTVLTDVAGRLSQHARAAAGRFAARLSGDEFVVLVTGAGALHPGLAGVAADLIELFAPPLELPHHGCLAVTASIGVAVGDATPLTSLLAQADAAMYRAKHDRRGQPGCHVHLDTEPERASTVGRSQDPTVPARNTADHGSP